MSNKSYVFNKNQLMAEDDIIFVPIDRVTQQTEDEFLFRFEGKAKYDAGQFFQCSIPGYGESAISICSYSKDYFELSIRAVGNVTHQLCQLQKGDKIGLRGPYGRGYEMNKFNDKDIVVIGGGSGVAAVRGVIQYIAQNRKDFGTVDLLFGFRNKEFMLFEADYNGWKNKDMGLKIAMNENNNYPGATKGLITDILDDVRQNDNKNIIICGPPIMIKFAAKALLEKNFEKAQIYISEERHMKCAVGRCGHCMIKGKYCCTDGPVFRYDELY